MEELERIMLDLENEDLTEEQYNYIKNELITMTINDNESIKIKSSGMSASNGKLIQQVVLSNGDSERHVCYI